MFLKNTKRRKIMPGKTQLDAKQAGLKYAQVIKDNPGKGKKASKSRRDAFVEYKKSLKNK